MVNSAGMASLFPAKRHAPTAVILIGAPRQASSNRSLCVQSAKLRAGACSPSLNANCHWRIASSFYSQNSAWSPKRARSRAIAWSYIASARRRWSAPVGLRSRFIQHRILEPNISQSKEIAKCQSLNVLSVQGEVPSQPPGEVPFHRPMHRREPVEKLACSADQVGGQAIGLASNCSRSACCSEDASWGYAITRLVKGGFLAYVRRTLADGAAELELRTWLTVNGRL